MAAGDGLVSMKPSSIAHSGTSASINADGGVDFSAVDSLTLNGVFTSDYDNYLIVWGPCVASGQNPNMMMQLRAAGTNATGSNYTYQNLYASSTTVAGARTSSQSKGIIGEISATQRSGDMVHIYGPALAQPTAWRTVNASGFASAYITDFAGTHSLSTAYDGFEITLNQVQTISGSIHVFGYEE